MPTSLAALTRARLERVVADLVVPGAGNGPTAWPVTIAGDQEQVLAESPEGTDIGRGLTVAPDALGRPGLGHQSQRFVPLLP